MRKSRMSKMKQSVLFMFMLILSTLSISLYAQTGLVWEDNFDSFDTGKWVKVDKEDWGGAPGCWYAPKNVVVSNGTLKLYSYEETYLAPNGYTYGWTGAKAECTYYPQYKYMVASVRHSIADSYIWATWWTIGWANGAAVWPPEFDMCEFAGQWGDWTPSQSSWFWGAGGVTYDTKLTNMDETQWHTYGSYWSDTDSMLFYVDGVVSATPNTPYDQDLYAMLMMNSSSPNRDLHPTGCAMAYMEVDYVRVYNTPPTQPAPPAHLASLKPATASSYVNTASTPKKAFDGYTSSRWESNWSNNEWVQVDLQAIASVNQVKLMWQYAAGKDYKIQVSSYPWGPWTDCTSITNNAVYDSWLTYNFTAQSGRFVRLSCSLRTTEWGYSLYEMQVFGTVTNPNPPALPNRTNLALGKTATASTTQVADGNGNYVAGNAVDGNSATRWASEWADPQWIYVDLGATYSINNATLNWEIAAGASAYQVQISANSGGPWTDCIAVTGSNGGLKINDFATQSGRYVRIYGTLRASGYGYSLIDMQLYGPTGGNNPPTVSITAPASGATYTAPASVTINANAADSDGTVSSVAFYQGTTLLGTDTSSPYSYSWTNVAAESYTLTAKATDNGGAVTTSSVVNITVNGSGGGGSLISQGKTATASSVFGGNAAANAVDGNVSTKWGSVWDVDPQWIYVDLGAVYTITQVILEWDSQYASSYQIQTATNTGGPWTNISSTTTGNGGNDTLTVSGSGSYVRMNGTVRGAGYGYELFEFKVYGTAGGGNVSPSVSITAPTNGATYTAPASVTISANASDSDGTISSVAFYQGATLLNTDTSSPYSYSWTGVAQGTYSLTAKATDNGGAQTTSAAVGITVNTGGGGGTLLSQGKTATASTVAGGNTAAMAVDGNMGTRWESASADPQWIYVDLTATATITQIILEWETAYGSAYQIQTAASSSGPWTDIYTTTTSNGGNDTLAVSGSGRYVRMNGTARGTGWGYSLYEFQVYGTAGGGNVSPTVSITAPANGATYTAPASVTINANASDSDGTITSVAFYQGATLLNTDTTSPYSYAWTGVAQGSYSLTAKATDNGGAQTTSAAIGITVNAAGGGTAPTYQAIGTAVNGTGAITVAWPAHQANDVALLVVETANQAVTLSTPAGFAAVTNSPQGTGTAAGTAATRLTVFWKRATTSAEASAVVADSGDHQDARIITFRGVVASGNPWDVTAGNTATASTSASIPGATTTVANTLVVAITANVTDTTTARYSAWANASLASITERMDSNTTQGNGGGIGIATGVKAAAGAYSATTVTLATSSVKANLSIALKPTDGGGGGDTLLSQGKTATASSVYGGTTAANAVDGSMSTKWGSVWDIDPQWIYVDLTATYTISQVILEWDGQYGSSYQIQTSAAAGGPWTDIYTTTTGNGGNDTLTVSGSGRYVRMNGTVRGVGYGYELFEFKVYGH